MIEGVNLVDVITLIFTGLTLAATFWVVYETRKLRTSQEQERKEVAFRAALNDIAQAITRLNTWSPEIGVTTTAWSSTPNQFQKLAELVDSVWIDPELWLYITGGSLIRIRELEIELANHIQYHNEGTGGNERRSIYYHLDIYLKQLIRYIYNEMRRQGLNPPPGLRDSKAFKPLPYPYDDPGFFDIRQGLPSLPREPKDVAFGDNRMSVLLSEAKLTLEANVAESRAAFMNYS